MDDLRIFFHKLICELEKCAKADREFVAHFSDPTNRTKLMLGCAERREGVLKGAITAFLKDRGETVDEWSYERYVDIIAYKYDWWLGERIAPVIAEVEHKIGEFKGTVSDLVRFPAHQKIAVFYEDELTSKKLQSRETEIRGVLAYQFGKGFCEARDTEYLVVFGPTTVSEEGIGAWRAIWFTSDWQKSAFL